MNKNADSVNIQTVMLQSLESFLGSAVKAENANAERLHEAMNYSLQSGGKRLRPLICMGMARAICGDFKKAIAAAAAIECIHTYSLIHDDLPCMDNDDYRRGRPTLHKEYNEWLALLAGDALLTGAFELVCNADTVSSENKIAMIRVIAQASGANGMVAGQAADMQVSLLDDDLRLNYIHRNKTGKLLRAAAICGAIAAEAAKEDIETAASFGDAFGMAFQITDDLIDAKSSLDEAGKCTGKDESAGKITFVTYYGLEKAELMACEYAAEATSALKRFGPQGEFLRELTLKLIDRKR